MKIKRSRPGFYIITMQDGTVWHVEERPVDPGYGGGWAWFAASSDGGVLDPLPTLRDVKNALNESE